ncbi:MAG: DUF1566 domain-containing protein [Rhodoferax sp.]|jgi:hypothetical protein|uniref:Lcl C-terminal domain-containing protein n=1 Tax=Rhodoferax sp. TaxID=50421 RepID=UPI001B4FAAF6|nr:DUF1566 domain-containing protein [Rhodoferax sp.]MBP9737385.1 DUF1566 domain-containing protein [Rhodoferax sp.]
MSKKSTSSRGSVCQALLALVSAWLLCSPATAQTSGGLLNDTGQTQCVNASNVLGACDDASTGNAATHPRQDGRFGRDVASPTKIGGGAAGFDFTPLDASGSPIALTGSPAVPSATPRCVKDNVTKLIWEVKTTSGLQSSAHYYAWGSNPGGNYCGGTVTPCNTNAYIAALNAADLCGETANDWRLPTRRELLSIVHYGLPDYSTAMIDVAYFPNTQANWYWTSDTYAPNPGYAWFVYFGGGGTGADSEPDSSYVRLVRSGQ